MEIRALSLIGIGGLQALAERVANIRRLPVFENLLNYHLLIFEPATMQAMVIIRRELLRMD
jgi:hypothetical protein